jgi:small subunit ribosomal protein S6
VPRKKQDVEQLEDKRLTDYELIYIVSPEVTDEELESRIEAVNQFISGRNGTVDEVEKWGKRKLAYPIKHFLEGNYILTRFKISPAQCKELESNLKITEEVLRHLLIKLSG